MTLHYETRGEGPPVLLLHAGGLDSRMWGPLAQRLEDRFTLVMPDQRAHGRTPAPDRSFAPAEDTIEVLDGLGIERAPVVGNSFGGRVALQLATVAPKRASALVLLAAALPEYDRSPELQRYFDGEEALWEAGDIDGVVALNVRAWLREPAHEELFAAMVRTACDLQRDVDEVPERELPVDLAAISVPTLAVSGGRDFPDFARLADRIAAEVPGAQRSEIPDAGHMIALDRPDETAALIEPFLR